MDIPETGIEAITCYVPRHFLDLKTLAKANGVDPAKYYFGLGGRGMAVASPHEDPVTMAVEASMGLFENYPVDPETIGMLVVGTETSVDAAKPIAAYVHGMLKLPRSCRTFDTKHACYGATAALRLAAEWSASPSSGGRKALVVATDIASYDLGSPGEPTQGAGAVAMVVSTEPRILCFDPHPGGVSTREVMDFWRPHYRDTALVRGHASIDCYLDALEYTYREYESLSGLSWDDYDHILFHVPFPKMAYKAYKRLYDLELKRRRHNGLGTLEMSFEKRSMASLWAARELGNIYSGSLYLSLASLLKQLGRKAQNAKVALFSYGSGSCAEFFSGRIGPDAAAWRDRIGIGRGLASRIELDYEGYLRFRKESLMLSKNASFKPSDPSDTHPGKVSFRGIKDHRRIYEVLDTEAVAKPAAESKRLKFRASGFGLDRQ